MKNLNQYQDIISTINSHANTLGIGNPIPTTKKEKIEESDLLEFKSKEIFEKKQRDQEESYKKSIPKGMCAFLNNRGGVILIGVEDDGVVQPINSKEGNSNIRDQQLTQIINEKLECMLDTFDIKYYFLTKKNDSDFIIVIYLKNHPYEDITGVRNNNKGEDFYFRIGSSSEKMDRKEIKVRRNDIIKFLNNDNKSMNPKDKSVFSLNKSDDIIIDFLNNQNIRKSDIRHFILENAKGNLEIAEYLHEEIKNKTFNKYKFIERYKANFFKNDFNIHPLHSAFICLAMRLKKSDLMSFLVEVVNISPYEAISCLTKLVDYGIMCPSTGSSLLPLIFEIELLEKTIIEYPNLFINDFIIKKAIDHKDITKNILMVYQERKKSYRYNFQYGIPKWVEKIVLQNKNIEYACAIFSSLGKRESYFLYENINEVIKLSYFAKNFLNQSNNLNVVLKEIFKNTEEQKSLIEILKKWIQADLEKKRILLNYLQEKTNKKNRIKPFFYEILSILITPIYSEENMIMEGDSAYLSYKTKRLKKSYYKKQSEIRDRVIKLFLKELPIENLTKILTDIFNEKQWIRDLTRNNLKISQEEVDEIIGYVEKGWFKIIDILKDKSIDKSKDFDMLKHIEICSPSKKIKEKIKSLFPTLHTSDRAIIFPKWIELEGRDVEAYVNSKTYKDLVDKYYIKGFESLKEISVLKSSNRNDFTAAFDSSLFLIKKIFKKIKNKDFNKWKEYVLSNQSILDYYVSRNTILESIKRELFSWEKDINSISGKLKDEILISGIVRFTEKIPKETLLKFLISLEGREKDSYLLKKLFPEKILYYNEKEYGYFPLYIEKFLSSTSDDVIRRLFIVCFVLNDHINLDKRKKYFDSFIEILKNCVIKESIEPCSYVVDSIVIPPYYLNDFLKLNQELIENVLEVIIDSINKTSDQSYDFTIDIFTYFIKGHLGKTNPEYRKKIIFKICTNRKMVLTYFFDQILIICISKDKEIFNWFLKEKSFREYHLIPFRIYDIDRESNEYHFERLNSLSEATDGIYLRQTIHEQILNSYIRPYGTRSITRPVYKQFDSIIEFLKTKSEDKKYKLLANYLIKGLEEEKERLKEVVDD